MPTNLEQAPQPRKTEQRWGNNRQTAAKYGFSVMTLDRMKRKHPDFPRPTKVMGGLRNDWDAIDAWMRANAGND